jgi:hypothetical protein
MAALLLALPTLSGCFNIDLVAPPGADITLVSSKQPTTVRREYRTWFVVWGLSPLDNHMPELTIGHEKLTDVRVVVEDNIPDALQGILYNLLIPIGLVTQTVIVEGNRAPPPEPPKAVDPPKR